MKYLFTILLFASTALVTIAQPVAPCPEGATYNAHDDTCKASTSQWLWNDGGWVFILMLIAIPTAIFVGRRYFGWFGGKSTPTPRPH
jgi:hypothetical protein